MYRLAVASTLLFATISLPLPGCAVGKCGIAKLNKE